VSEKPSKIKPLVLFAALHRAFLLVKKVMQTEPKTNSGTQGEASSQEKQFKILHEILNEYTTPKELKDLLYELLSAAMSSEEVDGSNIMRSDFMLLHKRMCDLIDAVDEIINKE
jgi:hypothetical protein